MILTILIVIFAVALLGGGIGHARYGYVGWSPAGLILGLLLIMWLTGNLRLH